MESVQKAHQERAGLIAVKEMQVSTISHEETAQTLFDE
jgi:hypothetical protein